MSDVSSPRAVDRSVVHAGFAIGLISVGALCGVLYLFSAFFSPMFGEFSIPALLSFVEAFSKGCLMLLAGFAGWRLSRGAADTIAQLRFAGRAGVILFAGFAALSLLLSAIGDAAWTVSYVRGQGAVPVLLFLALFAALALALERPQILRQFTVH
jgi:hypothetical protein